MSNIFKTMTTALKGDCPSEQEINEVPSYIFCRWLSGNPNTITIANIFNYFHKIPIKNQYDVVRALFHNKIRFISYPKSDKDTLKDLENLEYIKKYYKVNDDIAKQYLEVISDEELSKIIRAYKIIESR